MKRAVALYLVAAKTDISGFAEVQVRIVTLNEGVPTEAAISITVEFPPRQSYRERIPHDNALI